MDSESLNRPLRVADLIATKRGEQERGPMVIMNPRDAQARLLTDGELAWVYGPRRQELATVHVDEDVRLGDVVLRDVLGAAPSETVRVIKPDFDRRGRPSTAYA
ncbi:MAG TPA: molybdopterin dinucleotide binding domain-containing protein [Gemmatimonadaceae bacterium]|nr:molybdopterin dinucleotide binding domain-containing protein [Gemmatimonadaceae bacterium]